MSTNGSPSGPTARILVVEDDGIVALGIEKVLLDSGLQVAGRASSAAEAMQCASTARPDLALMDIHIRGELDGIETAELLRREFDIPVAYLTGCGDTQTLDRIQQRAPGSLLLKPYKPADLRNLVQMELYRVRAARAAHEREFGLSTMLRCLGDAVISTDREMAITFMNDAAESLTGWRADEARGRRIEDVVVACDEATGTSLSAMLTEGMSGCSPYRARSATLVTRKGAPRHVSNTVAPLIAGNELIGAIVAIDDITEERSVARQVELTERMASLGRQAAAIAHDLEKPLALVLANLHHVCEDVDSASTASDERSILPADVGQAVRDARTGAERIHGVVTRLRRLGAPEPRAEAIDIAEMLRWALATLEPEWSTRTKVDVDVQELPKVVGDEARVGQLVLELVAHAAKQIPDGNCEGGWIRIEGRRGDDGRAVVRIFTTGAPIVGPSTGSRDLSAGAGGPSSSQQLSFCAGIARELGGALDCEPCVGGGSVVCLRLPAARTVS